MIDSHCHIDAYDNPIAVARDAEKSGVKTIAVTNLPSKFEIAYQQFRQFRRVRLALGLHPLFANQHQKEIPIFRLIMSQTSYIGEVGLDFSKEGKGTKELQLESFRFVLNLIKDQNKFISIHSRGAEAVVLDLLKEYSIKGSVFHWYSGSLSTAARAVDDDHYFSINPAMIRSKKGRILIESIPKGRIITETDGPYVQIDKVPLRPVDVRLVVTALKYIWHLSKEEVEKQIDSNFETIIEPIRRSKSISIIGRSNI